MNLCLSVISYHRFTSGVEEKKFLSSDSGESVITIGRASQCSWCLLDPERVISSRHARVELNNQQFWLYDTSTNGVFVNRGVEPMAKETPYLLSDGDILAIGDYEIEVQLVDSVSEQQQKPLAAATQAESTQARQAFSDANFGVLADTTRSEMVTTQSKQPDPVSLDSKLNANLDDAFLLPPSMAQDEQSNIPEDWNALFGQSSSIEEPVVNQAEVLSTPEVIAVPTPLSSEAKPANTAQNTQRPFQQTHAQMAATIAPATAVVNHQNGNVGEQAHLNAFLEGMGISAELISQDNPTRWWHQLGVITRDCLDGIMNTLDNRAAFKENSRINQTTFRKNENNPLKFSTNAEDAIHNLLQRKTAGFLPPERAVKEAFIDLERHEYALLSGVEGAVAGLMQLLDPKSIESKGQNDRGIARYYSAIEKHKSWNRYCSVYGDLENEFSRNCNAFYMEDFAKAYEATLKSIEQKGQR